MGYISSRTDTFQTDHLEVAMNDLLGMQFNTLAMPSGIEREHV